ncbi:ATP-dependent Clp protease ATP-binding subunit [uncultured Gemmiger sp.]|uniref:ATP-dependent Clp protease ATP-binding subunit n=1 Tax=uncultured Gemmiger sp. TaxID=1623490 RepID=UPI0025FCCDB0|nr:ATP-dependent Clp protease ATP-binding subunit [uncultured Gemmiger sp.]
MFYFHKGLSRRTCRTVGRALTLAGQEGCSAADTGHLLLAMLETDTGPAADFLHGKRITCTALQECAARRSCAAVPQHLGWKGLAPESRKALEFAQLGAQAARVCRAENEHLLCAMLEDCACTASMWLAELGVEVPQAARECRRLSGQLVLPAQPRMSTARSGRPSEKYGRDLTRLAQEGKLDPVLCRDSELERMIEILCRRQKNNPCLLGEPGVGKSALVEALAQRIAEGKVTGSLLGKRVLALDMASMVAGTKYRGDFEERFKNLLEELYRDRSTILFIDEIHVIAGAGAAEGAIDAASILKPMLARGEIQLIGATTPEEYRKTIGKDSALDRRFGQVMVEEPTPADAEKILTGLMPRYERYHGITIPADAIHAAVELSVRYLPGRYLPDKAIDLLDEAAAAARIGGRGGAALAPADIAHVVSRASGVPAERVGEAERERLSQLEERLAHEVVGQPRAVQAVAAAIRRSRTGLREPGRPIGAMLFLGPTGVGKTQLARTLAESWFGSDKALLRFDMSEYMEGHTVARLLGSPPGYVGHEEGGQLTEAVRRRPYSVVLFDEIEKAHSDIQNVLLQILEDGCLTDAQGRKADFSNTIILLTSNLGARCLAGQTSPMGFGAAAEESDRRGQKALQEAREFFRPELMGRLDEIVLFDPLGPQQLTSIADRLLTELELRAAQQGYTLHHTHAAAVALAGNETPAYGARELRRKVGRAVEQALADRIASGDTGPGAAFTADADPDGHIVLVSGDMAACV